MKLINPPGDLYNDRRLNLRVSSADVDRLQRIKRARLIASDSEVIRLLIDEEHEALQASGAFRTVGQACAASSPESETQEESETQMMLLFQCPDCDGGKKLTTKQRNEIHSIEQQIRQRWRRKLNAAVEVARHAQMPTLSAVMMIDSAELHELFTMLCCDPQTVWEGCNAGCAQLPEGWCKNCDRQRNGT